MFALYLCLQFSLSLDIKPNEGDYTPHDPIRETTVNIDIKKCSFNNLDNLEQNGGAILITTKKKVNCTINDCQFNQCKAKNGGAIHAFYSEAIDFEFSIINSIFTGCQCQSRGGAVYIQSGQPLHHTFSITGCTFNNNKAAYGGGLYAELRDQLNLDSCTFNNNEASKKGSSSYFKLGHENIKNAVEEHDTFKIHNNIFVFNPSSENPVNVFIENDKITDTTDPAHANVFLGGCTFTIEGQTEPSTEYLHLEVVENEGGFESFTFDACNCVHQDSKTVKVASKIYLFNVDFGCESIDKCTSDQASFVPTEPPTPDVDGMTSHEPIQETTTAIDLNKCKFNGFGNIEKNGGAILITFAKKVNCKINDCKFNDCKGKNGGAISASYSKTSDFTFEVLQSTFSGCLADSKGGAIYVQSAQPLHHSFKINGCTFNENKAYNGGGLYAELRDQLNIENCRFTNNEATSKGSSAYFQLGHSDIKNTVEEHDTFYIHNNVFIFNPNSAEAVNVYVENDLITDTADPAHANVFLGGCTFSVASSRIAKSDFLHLEVVENEGGFESFTFDSCNCVQQDKNTVKVESSIKFANFSFGCSSIDKCVSDSNGEVPSSDSSSSSSSSLNDKDSDDDNNNDSNSGSGGKNKPKIGLIVGIAAACVVVVIIIVVVVLIVIRKKLSGRYVNDIRTDDIAENLNADGASSNQDFNNQNSAL